MVYNVLRGDNMTKETHRNLVSVKVYFKLGDKVQMEVYKSLQELSKSIGVSVSTAAGMSLRRGVPIVKNDWDSLMRSKKK